MSLLILMLPLALLFLAAGLPAFELTFLVILAAPIFAFLIGSQVGVLNAALYAAVIVIFTLLVLLIASKGRPKLSLGTLDKREAAPVLLFCLVLFALHRLSLLWPDFIAIGERLRDYALLASAINYPLEAREPWMAGSSLNYYMYWYRLGHFLSSMLRLPVWDVYHLMAAFSLSFYLTALFRLLNRHLGFSWKIALLLAVFIALGSNAAGVMFFLERGTHWWGPSRVIHGAINEFPAWSFLLGDLHPHYLSLGLVPFFTCLGLLILEKRKRRLDLALLFVGAGLIGSLWLYNSNAWEVPIWLAFLGCSAVFLFTNWAAKSYRQIHKALAPSNKTAIEAIWPHLTVLILMLLAGVSLYLSSRNILSPDHPVKFVAEPVPYTKLPELFSHWGIPLTLIALCQIGLQRGRETAVIVVALLAASLFFDLALAPLLALLLLGLWRFISIAAEEPRPGRAPLAPRLIAEACGITALALIIVPEICYLDDPYGGENERMNTIFKIYSAVWFMLHLYAFNLVRELWAALPKAALRHVPVKTLLAASAILMLGFFYHTISLRKSSKFDVRPVSQGLNNIEERFPGAAQTIQSLERLEHGVVLEAQGPAYDITSHVATLAGKESYLGWANHAGLLTRKHEEVKRRENVTDAFYQGADCEENLNLLRRERIDYVVLGPLERRRYPQLSEEQFACLKKTSAFGQYLIYKTKP